MHAIFSKRYEYQDGVSGITRMVPAGWAGDLPEAVVQDAVAGGFATSPEAPKKAKAKAGEAK